MTVKDNLRHEIMAAYGIQEHIERVEIEENVGRMRTDTGDSWNTYMVKSDLSKFYEIPLDISENWLKKNNLHIVK